ncbi:glycosyltransferase [Candidatus Falkowbacteria bacterium]|nr:glycosyltransferase [Candidatus Falkowbacteria bacterium]
MKIYCVLPAYNEQRRIGEVLKKLKFLGYNIVVVDDGSRDDTEALARSESVVVIKHFINRGQGAALETGNQYALAQGADVIVHFDADGQFFAEEIKDVIEPLIKGEAEAVFGSRFMGKPNNMPAFKKNFIMPIGRMFNRAVLGVETTDPQSGFRAMTAEAWKKIKIEQNKMAHASEILFKAHKLGLKIKEVPITVIYHDFGQRFSGGIRIFKDLLLAKLMK